MVNGLDATVATCCVATGRRSRSIGDRRGCRHWSSSRSIWHNLDFKALKTHNKTRNWGLIERQSSQLTIEGKGNRDYLFTLKKGSQRLIWPLYRDKTHLLRLKCVKTFKLTLIRWVVGSVLVRVELEFSDVVNRLGGMDLGSGMVGFGFLGRILRRR